MSQTEVVIIGGGITGLSLAAGLEQRGIPFVLLETQDRLGGQIRTLRKNGFTFEIGPNTGSVSNPEVTELFEYAEGCQLQEAKDASKARWIWKGDRFLPLPSGLGSAITTPLFRLRDKFRILGEPWRAKGTDPNETVGALAERRLGKSFVDYAVDPFLGGVYAGDPYRLVTRFALPKLYNLEANHGSFVRGSFHRPPQTERDKKATKKVFSAVGGLEQLVQAVAAKAGRGGEIITSAADVHAEYRDPHDWLVTYTHGGEAREISARNVVTTVRAEILASILPAALTPRLGPIEALVYSPVTEVCIGYDHLPGVSRAAFGGLVPSREKRGILGVLFPSSCFEGRTEYPDGALFTVFMGGIRQGEKIFSMSEAEVAALAQSELEEMLKIPAGKKPTLINVARYPRAIAQYYGDTEQRLECISTLETEYPGLVIAGSVRDGIGLAHRIKQGADLAIALSSVAEHRG